MSGILSFSLRPLTARSYSRASKFDILTLCNGILIGLVAISGACDRCENWGAIIIGTVAAFFYLAGVWLLEYLQIDDAIETSVVHMLGGIWGLIAVALFDNFHGALFRSTPHSGLFVGYQFVGIAAILGWTSVISIAYFFIMKQLNLLRLDRAVEVIGMDVCELNGNVPESFINEVRHLVCCKPHLINKDRCDSNDCCGEKCCGFEGCCPKVTKFVEAEGIHIYRGF